MPLSTGRSRIHSLGAIQISKRDKTRGLNSLAIDPNNSILRDDEIHQQLSPNPRLSNVFSLSSVDDKLVSKGGCRIPDGFRFIPIVLIPILFILLASSGIVSVLLCLPLERLEWWWIC